MIKKPTAPIQRFTLDGHVDLGREFVSVGIDGAPEDDSWRTTLRRMGNSVEDRGWSWLRTKRCVVILGEANAGKTSEIRAEVDRRRQEGEAAFYIPLASASGGLETSLSPEERAALDHWRNSRAPGSLFLDSIDEALLRGHEKLEEAINRLENDIRAPALGRANLVFTCRQSEWRNKDDRILIARFARIPAKDVEVVTLAPLDSGQAMLLVGSRLDEASAKAFYQQVDNERFGAFSGRPRDLLNLIDYWQRHKRMGTARQTLAFFVDKLAAQRTDRAEPGAPSPSQIVDAARRLAAATILTGRVQIAAPDVNLAPNQDDAVDPARLLPELSIDQRRAVLHTGLFAPAAYGRIRFYHRDVADFLYGEWLEKLVETGGLGERELIDHCCPIVHGRRVPIPSRIPGFAWLAAGQTPWRQRLCQVITACDPMALIDHGDVGELSPAQRVEILRSIDNRQATWDRWRYRGHVFARLGCPEVGAWLADRLASADCPEAHRYEYLLIAWHAKLAACAAPALKLFADPSMDEGTRSVAALAVGSCGDNAQQCCLVESAKNTPLSPRILSSLVQALYPGKLSPPTIIALIESHSILYPSHDSQSDRIAKLVTDSMPEDHVWLWVETLLPLLPTPPPIRQGSRIRGVSDRYGGLIKLLAEALGKGLTRRDLLPDQIDIAALSIMLMGQDVSREYHLDKIRDAVRTRSLDHPRLRRQVALAAWEQLPLSERDAICWRLALDQNSCLIWHDRDFDWLVDEAKDPSQPELRRSALGIACDLARANPGLWRRRRKALLIVTANDDQARAIVDRDLPPQLTWAWRRRLLLARDWYRRCLPDRWYLFRLRARDQFQECRWYFRTYRNIRRIRSGRHPIALRELAWRDHQQTQDDAMFPGDGLSPRRYPFLASAFQEGCSAFWRFYSPRLAHELQPNEEDANIYIGLTGLELEWRRGVNWSKLNLNDARIASRYAFGRMMAFPDWLPTLLRDQRDGVLIEGNATMKAEWVIPHRHGVITKLAHADQTIKQALASGLVDLILGTAPTAEDNLWSAIETVLGTSRRDDPALRQFLAARAKSTPLTSEPGIKFVSYLSNLDPNLASRLIIAACLSEPNDAATILHRLAAGRYWASASERFNFTISGLAAGPLGDLIRCANLFIRRRDDLRHDDGSSFSHTSRDDTQSWRSMLLEAITQLDDPDVPTVLANLRATATMKDSIEPLDRAREIWFSRVVDHERWQEDDVLRFERDHESVPKTASALYRLVATRIDDIKFYAERHEIGRFAGDPDERGYQLWLQDALKARSRNLYHEPREAELPSRKKPDFSIVASGISQPVVIEIKRAQSWSLSELKAALLTQLLQDYLVVNRWRHGLLVLIYGVGRSHWEDDDGNRLNFDQLVARLNHLATDLPASYPVDNISVVGINLVG